MSGGNPFQTFYIMFKSNATQAKKDMDDLQKTSDQTKKKIKDTKEETNELGKSFTDAVENGMRALAAYASFNAFKSGIMDAQKFNRELTIQTGLWGQNANEINAWGKTVKQAGGDAQSLFSWYNNIRQQQASIGRSALPIGELMRHINRQVQGQSPEMKQMVFQQYGIGDIGQQAILSKTPEELEKVIESISKLTSNTNDGASASQKFGTSWDNLTSSLEKFWTTVNSVILPPLSLLLDGLEGLFNMIANNKAGATAFFVAMSAAALAFTASIPAIVAGFGTISAAALSALPAIARFAGVFGAIALGASAIVEGSSAAGKAIGHYINRRRGFGDANGYLPGQEGYSGSAADVSASSGSAMDYLMSKYGLDADHAAGIVSNMQHESGGRPGARGDGGLAHGLFQWHPDRRAKILAGTGIDVSSAGANEQIDAMMWELNQRGQRDPYLQTQGAFNAGSFISSRYEIPADGVSEAMKRGMTAMDIAGSTPFASQASGASATGGEVRIDRIEVNTQATDANGIARDIGSAMKTHIGGMYANNNDAIAY